MTLVLRSYVGGEWFEGKGSLTPLVNPSTEEVLAHSSTHGLDFSAALDFARAKGGPALRGMTFAQRGAMLQEVANAVHAHRDELLDLSQSNGGNTRGDAKFDVDGAMGTLAHYATLGKSLGETRFLVDGEPEKLGRSPRWVGRHVFLPLTGAAVHVNAFNFPAWGFGEKAAVAWLAGMPVVTKPATSTAVLASRLVEILVERKCLPEGALSFIAGSPGDLLDHVGMQDVVAFTGSSDTGAALRARENVIRQSVRLNVEADSLNAAVLGPDVEPRSATWDLFMRDVVRDMTQKAGQKCTAIRRVFVPSALAADAREDLVEQLSAIKVGNPASSDVRMGPLSTRDQLRDVRAGVDRLRHAGELALGDGGRGALVGVDGDKGYFMALVLVFAAQPEEAKDVHAHEVFGPVATLMPYSGDADEAIKLVRLGQGGLVSSVYTDDKEFATRVVFGIASHHGRVNIGSEKIAEHAMGPGAVLPQLVHGGPGRAGGGEELGGLRGMELYLQRTALQGDEPLLARILADGATGRV